MTRVKTISATNNSYVFEDGSNLTRSELGPWAYRLADGPVVATGIYRHDIAEACNLDLRSSDEPDDI